MPCRRDRPASLRCGGFRSVHQFLPKSIKPRCGSALNSFTCMRSPTSSPCSPRISRPSTGGSMTRTNTPFGVTPVTTAENAWPTAAPGHRGDALGHVALHLARGVFLQCAVAGDARQFVVGVRRAAAAEQRLQQPLRHQVGEAAVGRGGVRVVVRRQAEMALSGVARAASSTYSPGPISLSTASDTSAIVHRVGLLAPRRRNALSARGIGRRAAVSRRSARPVPRCAAIAPAPCTTRRIDGHAARRAASAP